MAPRKAHTKSRRGCTPCKQRRVKCNEDGFPCGNCIKRDLKCVYPTPKSSAAVLDPSPRSALNGHESGTAAQSDTVAFSRMSRLSDEPYAGLGRSEELYLVHHYVNLTCESFCSHPEDTAVWRSAVLEDSVRFPFVLDAVLALASLHRATSSPEKGQEYISSSLFYQSRGLQGYAKQFANITQENCQAVFAFSMLINVLTIAASVGFPGISPVLPIDTLFASFELLRGIGFVWRASSTMLIMSPYKILFSKTKSCESQEVFPGLNGALQELRWCAAKCQSDLWRTEIYQSTIDRLHQAFEEFEGSKNVGTIVAWPILISATAMDLLKEQDPIMMLIFIHYGVLYLQVHNKWWAHNFGVRLIRDLSKSLHAISHTWLPHTRWARSKVARVSIIAQGL